ADGRRRPPQFRSGRHGRPGRILGRRKGSWPVPAHPECGGRTVNRVKVRPVAIFTALSFGLAWLVALPMWLDGGLLNPLAPLLLVVMMATPAIAALVVTRFVDRPASIPRELGLWPLRPAGRLLKY